MFKQMFKMVLVAMVLLSTTVFAKSEQINAAGASFPYPLYMKWFSEYNKQTNVAINYQSIGSGSGIRQTIAKTVDFGASDAPMKDTELAKVKDNKLLHIPTVMGAVVVSYKLPSVKTQLNLSGSLIADIYLGKVIKWNDERIQALNKGVELPNKNIIVVHRSDGSGTTNIFTEFLAKVSPEWAKKVKFGKAVRWPTGLGGKGNEGVAGIVKQAEGAIGYLEYIYAKKNKLPAAKIQNATGAFVSPSIEGVTHAAAALKDVPEDFRMSITNPQDNPNAYPIAAFTYLLVYQNMTGEKGKKIKDFLNWAVEPSKGQVFASELSYAPLPPSLVAKVKDKINTIKVN